MTAALSASAKIFWFRRKSNFGDTLAPLLVERFAGLTSEWSRPEASDAVVIGSVAGRLPRRYRGAVVGIGKISEDIALDLSNAQVVGLRGALTLRGSGITNDVALGDPGLLVAELLGEDVPRVHPLGVVAHYVDPLLDQRYPDAHHIDVTREPLHVVRQIASCQMIVSSSLHGLITADSFGIPRRWEPSEAVVGGRFKFDDYASALGTTFEPNEWSEPPRQAVEAAASAVRDAFAALPAAISARQPARLMDRAWQLKARFDRV